MGDQQDDHEDTGKIDRTDLARIALVAAAAAAVWFRVWEPFARVSVLGLVGTLGGGWPIFHEATALVITAFVLAAEVLEGLTVGRGRRAIRNLLDFLPATATVRRTGLVAPGESIAVDGRVRSGHSYVDQATITGESTPAEKSLDAIVYAGTINQSGTLEIVADRVGRDTSFGRIVEAVEHAERSRAPAQKTADRYARYLVYFALACAALTFALTRDARSAISVIIVAGACGIAAGTPLAVLGAIGRAARGGAIIKGGRYLERCGRLIPSRLTKPGR
jgi:Cu+-exporting ATPase